jgi:rod shape-determining protein MreD
MTKRYLYFFLFSFLLFLVEASAVRVWTAHVDFVPQLTLLFVIVMALKASFPETLWFAFLTGFLQELFSAQFFGAQIFGFVLTAVFVYFATRKLTAQEISVPTAIGFVVAATALFNFWIFVYDALGAVVDTKQFVSLTSLYSWKLIWQALANLLLFYPIRFFFKFWPK